MKCRNCLILLHFEESLAIGSCYSCRTAESKSFVLALCDRIFAAHEVIGRRAEKREVVLTEVDSCPLG